MTEVETSDSDSIALKAIVKAPWVASIILCYFTFSVIILAFYGISSLALFFMLIPLIVLLFIIDEEPYQMSRAELGKVTWLIVFWVYALTYLGGGGVFRYLPSIVTSWAFKAFLLAGALVILRTTSPPDEGRMSQIGLRRGFTRNALQVIAICAAMFSPVLIGLSQTDIYTQLDFEKWIDFLVTTTLLTAIVEEIVFRGIIQEGLACKYNNRTTGLLLGSLIFGFGHTWTNVGQHNDIVLGFASCFIFQFVVGLILGAVYERTDSVVPAIVVHYFYNAYVWLQDSATDLTLMNQYWVLGWTAALILLLVFIVWPTIKRIPHYVEKLYKFIVSLLTCIMRCIVEKIRMSDTSP